MDILTIGVTKQGKAVNFALGSIERNKLFSNFPEAKLLRVLQIPYEIEDSLEPHKAAVIQHIVPLLLGLPYEKTKQIGTLLFTGPWTQHEFLKVIQKTPHEIEQV